MTTTSVSLLQRSRTPIDRAKRSGRRTKRGRKVRYADRLRPLFNVRPVGRITRSFNVARFVYGGDGHATRWRIDDMAPSTEYVVTCECGSTARVTSGMAGSTVRCDCGRHIPIPALSDLRNQPASAPSDARQSFGAKAAQLSWQLPIAGIIVTSCLTNFLVSDRQVTLAIGLLFIVVTFIGLIAGLVAIASISRFGWRRILIPACVGIVLNAGSFYLLFQAIQTVRRAAESAANIG